MIRFFYWLLATLEVLLFLVIVVLFIITDSRTIKILADNVLPSTPIRYESLEGNLFTGLEVSKLSYENHVLFDSAILHWNPLTLLYKKITLTQIDAEGVDVESILKMIDAFESNSSSSGSVLDLSLSLENLHLDINPYVYKGVKFSSFLFEMENVEIARDLMVDTEALYLYFDSDLVNVEVVGRIKQGELLVDILNLKEISIKDITQFTQALNKSKEKNIEKSVVARESKSKEKRSLSPIKEIRIKHIFATLKAVQYGPLKIEKAKFLIDDAKIDPLDNFNYQAQKIDFTGKTNFFSPHYKGYIKDSMIYSKGELLLHKELFNKYDLPLNYKNLRKLSGALHLNHHEVWIDVNHKVKKLLKIKSDFNLDVLKGKHKIYYNYKDKNLTVTSKLKIKMPYADKATLNSLVAIDAKTGKTIYTGDVEIPKVKNLPKEVSDYLLKGLHASYRGEGKELIVKLESDLLKGDFITRGFKNATIKLESKKKNILLSKLISGLPDVLKNEKLTLKIESFFDFKKSKKSKINLKIVSDIINLNTDMKLIAPYKIHFKGRVPFNSVLLKLNENIQLNSLQDIEGEVAIYKKRVDVSIHNNKRLKLTFSYHTVRKNIENAKLLLGDEVLELTSMPRNGLHLKSQIVNLHKFLLEIEKYYKLDLPNIQGKVDLDIQSTLDGVYTIDLRSPKLSYLSTEGVSLSILSLENIALNFKIDKQMNITVNNYKFKLDNNDYLTKFYATKKSFLNIRNNTINIKELWLNDNIKLFGSYDLKKSRGDIQLLSKGFPLKDKDFDLLLELNLLVKLRAEKINVEGDIYILGNNITYELEGSNIVEDADIIIIQDMLAKEEDSLKNLKLYLKIKNRKPLKYFGKDTNIDFYNELQVVKNYGADMLITGMSTITEGYYQLEDKHFTLNESHLYFTGDPKKPLLDIKANYVKDQYTIHIFISGSTDEPIVNFNSDPYLSQQEILSLILFDGTGSGQGAEAYTLLGGTFAKGLIKSLGIDVDHLLLGTDADDALSLEIGRKISDDITIMYMHKDGLDGAKVRIEHSNNFETDIIVQPPNTSSIEFLYRRDR